MRLKLRAPSGLTITAVVRRDLDGKLFDWDDLIFKSSGWTTVSGPVPEIVAAPIPTGYYETDEIDTGDWIDGIYTAFFDGASVGQIEIRIRDGDIWEALLDAAVSSRAAAPPAGSVITTIAVKEDDTGGVPVAGVQVSIRSTTNAFIDQSYTDTAGQVVFTLDAGTYYVYLARIGVPMFFTRPQVLVVPVGADYAVEYYGIPFVPIAPTSPGVAVVYDYLFNLGLDARPGIEVKAMVSHPARTYLADGPILSSLQRTRTDATGLFQFTLPRQVDLQTPAVKYAIEIEAVGFYQEFDAADLDAGGAFVLSSLESA